MGCKWHVYRYEDDVSWTFEQEGFDSDLEIHGTLLNVDIDLMILTPRTPKVSTNFVCYSSDSQRPNAQLSQIPTQCVRTLNPYF